MRETKKRDESISFFTRKFVMSEKWKAEGGGESKG